MRQPPLPLQRWQTRLVAILCVAVAVSRWFALSASQLDWDESLFIGGVRHYDVIAQHPHPPGYPLFILFAKMLRPSVRHDFRALQGVVAIASTLLFPATFFLLREMRFSFRVAIAGAILTVFLPTVWYYGGTALSDVPALCAAVIASALFLAGARDPRLWIAGAFMAGITGGIRPLHVLIVAVPAVVGWKGACTPAHSKGIAIFAAVIAASYAGAALATPNPPWGYLQQIGMTSHHIASTDSFDNMTRPPLPKLAPMFFLHVQRGGRAGIALLAFAVIGLAAAIIRRSVAIAMIAAMFTPIAIVSWMMLDLTAVTRYGLAYVMLYPICAAFGIDAVARIPAVTSIAVTILAGAMILWTWPALALVHNQPSPPVEAMRWIRAHVPPAGPQIYLADSLGYHAGAELDGWSNHFINTYAEIPPHAYTDGNYCLVDHPTIQPHALFFRYPRKRLADIARVVYFETSVIPMSSMIRFGDGWYQDEYDGPRDNAWKWAQKSSTMLVPPLRTNGVLRIEFHVPLNDLPRPPHITVIWNGTTVDQSACNELDNERRYVLPPRDDGQPNECRIEVDEAAQPKEDPRTFALQLTSISWGDS